VTQTPDAPSELIDAVASGDRKALARAISLVERGEPDGAAVVSALYPRTGRAFVLGVTGPSGVGKSTLVSALVRHLRANDSTVGVISVDPSSPFTRGALLGDRIRLSDHFLDPGVFIRSMGTRGHRGGLAEATLQTMLLLDASGKDIVIIETVGAGQGEVEITGVADIVVLVLQPGSGDSIQALKAGIMEIPDVIAINKHDLPEAATMLNDVRSIVGLEPDPVRRPELVTTSARAGEGVVELLAAIDRRKEALGDGELLERRRRAGLEDEILALAAARYVRRLRSAIREDGAMQELIDAVSRREVDPLTAAGRLAAGALEEASDAPDPL
jgi:LAO/AO transport system kinase